MLESFLGYLNNLSIITIIVMLLLFIYFIAINWVFLYKILNIDEKIKIENVFMQSLLMGSESLNNSSYLSKFVSNIKQVNQNILNLMDTFLTRESTKGLTFLSIVASSSPFIGLFGTVISILETFFHLGGTEVSSINVIASGISEALIATAVGIFVATFAYTYHQILKRKAYNLTSMIKLQCDIIISKNKSNDV